MSNIENLISIRTIARSMNARGFTGSQGFTGSSGAFAALGYTGSVGFTGSQGIQGPQGEHGFTGSRGTPGGTGVQGERGYTGSIGFVGSQGVQGVIGFTGSTGAYAAIGFTGSRGSGLQQWIYTIDTTTLATTERYVINTASGSFSVSLPGNPVNGDWVIITDGGSWGTNPLTVARNGSTIEGIEDDLLINVSNITVELVYAAGTWRVVATLGTQGTTGFTGSQGPIGFSGSQGTTGFVGSQGDIGFTGSQGTTGFVGSQGDTGFVGSQGNIGFTGSQGTAGTQGTTGFTGSQGASASVTISENAPQNPSAGNLWWDSNFGTMKIFYNDADSSQWVDASNAPQGIQGYTGSKGDIGFTGSQGTTGFTGSQGSTGFTGSLGFAGSQGTTGFTGSAGSGTSLTSADDTTTTALYPVMVGAAGSAQSVKTTSTKLTYNALAGALGIQAVLEKATVSATAATGTIAYDAATQAVLYYTSNASANWTLNIRGSSSVSLNTLLAVGQSVTIAFFVTNGSPAYYPTAHQIDGSSITPKWQGGTAPTSGNTSSIDAYVYTVVKTANATFTLFASQTKFA